MKHTILFVSDFIDIFFNIYDTLYEYSMKNYREED